MGRGKARKIICENPKCGKEFTAYRSDAKTCGDACRSLMALKRKANQPLSDYFISLIVGVAKLRGKDQKWIKRQMILHQSLLKDDFRNGYTEEEAVRELEHLMKFHNRNKAVTVEVIKDNKIYLTPEEMEFVKSNGKRGSLGDHWMYKEKD